MTTGNRLVVVVGASGAPRRDRLERHRRRRQRLHRGLHFTASDKTEQSVWTAPVTAGGGTKPAITVNAER